MGPRCFKCLMFSPSGPVELVFLVDLRAAEVCAIVIFMGVVCSDSIFLWIFLFSLFKQPFSALEEIFDTALHHNHTS